MQFPGGLRVQQIVAAPMFEVFQRIMLRIRFFVVILGSADPVHQHFGYVFPGHPDRLQRISVLRGLQGIIQPEFEVMAVAAFVVQPCEGITFVLTFPIIGAAFAVLIVHTALQKFGGHVFGQVMHQTLTVQPYAETVLHDKQLVFCNSLKVPFCLLPCQQSGGLFEPGEGLFLLFQVP